MKRKSATSSPVSYGNLQDNPNLIATNLRLVDRQKSLQDTIDDLTDKNQTLTRKLNEIADLTESDDDAEDLLDDIQDIAESIDGNGGNGNGGGGNGHGADDD